MSKAHETPAGHLVRYQDRLWLKAERPSRDYLNHYLVEAKAQPGLALVYIDPDTELALIAAGALLSETSERGPGEPAQPGDVLTNQAGQHFIKAQDIKKDGQRHLAYVDIASGEIRPRQERDLVAVYSAWTLIAD
jgi:hypothetical protein